MKHLKRLTAFILTLVLAVYGLPASPFALKAEGETAEAQETPMPETAMRFVQTGFDPAAGILTMSLQIKPDQTLSGGSMDFASEGMFVFQVDPAVMPVTRPSRSGEARKSLRVYGEDSHPIIGLIGDSINNEGVVDDFIASGKAKQVESIFGGPNGTVTDSTLYNNRTCGYMVSPLRTEETGMLDCYVQFVYNRTDVSDMVGEDGYMTVIELDFRVNADNTDGLFSGSFHVPADSAEARELLSQFSFTKNGTEVSMVMGAAGFVQSYISGGVKERIRSYYYDDVPLATQWRLMAGMERPWTWEDYGPATHMEGTPGLWYDNMEKHYTVRDFSISLENTYNTDIDPSTGLPISNPDFTIPGDESSSFPRYSIPLLEDTPSEDTYESGIPVAYLGSRNMPLRYYVSTTVSGNSEYTPEMENLGQMLESIRWLFRVEDVNRNHMFALEDCEVTPTGVTHRVPTKHGDTTGFYYVEEATLTGSALMDGEMTENAIQSEFVGKKVWLVYQTNGSGEPEQESFMTCPVGVTLDMLESDVSYYDMDTGEDVTVKAAAPQLHVSSMAADPNNYIWSADTSGLMNLQAIYFSGSEFPSHSIYLRLYRDAAVPSAVSLNVGEMPAVEKPDGSTGIGFHVGNSAMDGSGTESIDDCVKSNGIPFTSEVLDQYGNAMDGFWNTITVTPAQATKEEMERLGKEEIPFQMEQVRVGGEEGSAARLTSQYRIRYKDGHNANSVVPGVYNMTAAYGSYSMTREIYISKVADRLSYMRTGLTTSYGEITGEETLVEGEAQGKVIRVSYPVPSRTVSGTDTTRSETIRIWELANQWRNPDDLLSDLSTYDILPGIRSGGLLPIDLVMAETAGVNLAIRADDPSAIPTGVDVSRLAATGAFSYTNRTEDGASFSVTATASYGGITRFVRYEFSFYRDPQRLHEIKIVEPANQANIVVTVPLAAEESPNKYQLTARPVDQFGSDWRSWNDVMAAYADVVSGPWKIHVLNEKGQEAEPPTGVKLVSLGSGNNDNNNVVEVYPEARNCEFQVCARYGSVTSAPVTIQIQRQTSRPISISTPRYGDNNTITVPTVNESARTVHVQPLTVIDQYDDVMTDYSQYWSMKLSNPLAGSYIHLNRTNGDLTVDPCAPDCDVTLKVTIAGSRTSTPIVVAVRRAPMMVYSLAVNEKSLTYHSNQVYLTASGKTQYGEDQTLEVMSLTWVLEEVEFADGAVVKYREKIVDPDTGEVSYRLTGDITFDNGTRQYSTATKGNSLRLGERGLVNYSSVTDSRQIPVRMTVSVSYGGGRTATADIEITREASVAKKILIPATNTADGLIKIDVPTTGDVVTLGLDAYVRDQYDVIMHDAVVTWSEPEGSPEGVTADFAKGEVRVDHTAEQSTYHLVASYGTLPPVDVYVSIVKDGATLAVDRMELIGMRATGGAAVSNYTVTLPDKPLTSARTSENYTMLWRVIDNYDKPMSVSVLWTVESPVGGVSAEIRDVNKYAGIVTLNFSQEAWDNLDAGNPVSFVMKGTAASDSSKTITQQINVVLADSRPVYAIPTMTGTNRPNEEDGNLPMVPKRGEPNTEIDFQASVYDQYGDLMENEKAILTLTDPPRRGLTFTSVAGTGLGKAVIQSTILGDYINIQATPQNGTDQKVLPESKLSVRITRDARYPAELALDSHNAASFPVPEWDVDENANAPGEGAVVPLDLGAWVLNAYGAELTDMPTVYPVWEFVGDHEGVEFNAAYDDDGDGRAQGISVSLDISHRAHGSVTLRVSTEGVDKGNEYELNFVRTFTIELTRNDAIATYLYIEGVDQNGLSLEPLKRPYFRQDPTTYQFTPVVYDQYGTAMEDAEIVIDLESAFKQLYGEDVNHELEPIYAEEENPGKDDESEGEEPEEPEPIAYKIYRLTEIESPEEDPGNTPGEGEGEEPAGPQYERTLVAEFDRITGLVTVYTECSQLKSISLEARCDQVAEGGLKRIRLPITEDAQRRIAVVDIQRDHGRYQIREGDDPLSEYVFPYIYDQYGEHYGGQMQVVWSLKVADEKGNLVDYDQEMDEEGNYRIPDDFLVLLNTFTVAIGARITVQPASFFENKTIVLCCQAVGQTSDAIGYSDVEVVERRIAVNPNPPGIVVASFDAGDYGTLIGPSEAIVNSGEAPTTAPGVQTVEGYGFIGWTTDGTDLVDASKVPLYSDARYNAVYKDITDTKFLSGYRDGTLRPEEQVTRAEFVTMLVMAFGGYDDDVDYGESFFDVDEGRWYANYIAYAKEVGVVKGDTEGTFRPEDPITRAETARLLAAAIGLKNGPVAVFRDVPAGAWYEQSVGALYRAGVISGYEDGTFRPNQYIVRCEAAKMLIMITKNAPSAFERENIREVAYCPFTDVDRGHWAYAYILRAAGIA